MWPPWRAPYDAVADVFCRDIAHLRVLIHDKIQEIDGVVEVTTNLVTGSKHQSSLDSIAGAPPSHS